MADMNTETENAPAPPVIAGDHYDDDGEVLDSLVQQNAEPPAARDLPPARTETLHAPRATTRLLTQTVTVRATFGAVQLVPSDPDRLDLRLEVRADGPDESAQLVLADDPSKLGTAMGAYVVDHQGASITRSSVNAFENHTGPVYAAVIPAPLEEPVDVAAFRITLAVTTK